MQAFQLRFLVLLFSGLSCVSAATLSDVQAVYFQPMRNSLDQYLAEQISEQGVFPVVVDPKLASAVLTDRIDAPFLAAMDELFPKPDDKAAQANEEDTQAEGSIESGAPLKSPVNRSLGRPRGTLFLVDVASRRVLWSTFLKEYQATPNELHKQARQVVERLKKQLGGEL